MAPIRTLEYFPYSEPVLPVLKTEEVPVNVKFIREAAELTQRELAEKLTVSQSQVAKWERGEVEPNKQQRIALAALMPGVQTAASMWPNRGRTDTYPSAPPGGKPGTEEGAERRVYFARRNALIQGNDPDLAEARVIQDMADQAKRRARAPAKDG